MRRNQGSGKTALAVHWAQGVRRQFPDGQLYVNLRGYSPGTPMPPIEALSRFLRALAVPAEQVPLDAEEATDLYRTVLADKQVLVVLDNAHSADQVRPLLPGSPGCLVLVTSRDRLGGLVAREGAHRLTLEAMAASEAHALLARIVGTERIAADPEAAAELAGVCVHLPLALRIAAANLTNHPRRTVASYLGELRAADRLAALEVDGDSQTAVRAAFDLSYAALPGVAQRVFRLLGLVPGPDVTVDAAAALADTPPEDARRLLEQLANSHLVEEHAEGRYTFHDLLRRYAGRQCEEEESADERQRSLERLFSEYLRAADAAAQLLYPEKLRLPTPEAPERSLVRFDLPADALSWLDAERPNLVAAVRHAASSGPRRLAWLLADALRGYFYLRSYALDWLAVADAALGAARVENDLRGQAAHLSLAGLDWRNSNHGRAIDHYTRALDLSRRTGWAEGEATVLVNLGTVHWQSGRPERAAEHYQQALTLNQRAGWREGEAMSLGNLGTVYWELGRLTAAAEHHSDALTLHRKIGSRGGEALAQNNLGETLHLLGRLDEAADHLAQALTLHQEMGNRASEAETLRCLAGVHLDGGRFEQADRALWSAVEVGNRRAEIDALNTLGAIRARLGECSRALEVYERAVYAARDSSSRYPEAESLLGLADSHLALGDTAKALTYVRQALLIAVQANYRVLERRALTSLAQLHLGLGELGKAARYAEQALASGEETGYRAGIARAESLLGNARRLSEPEPGERAR